MDNNKTITIADEICPEVGVANFFTVHPGSTWGPRAILDYELILVMEGYFSLELESSSVEVNPGEVLCIFPQELHTFRHLAEHGKRGVISCIHLELWRNLKRRTLDYRLAREPERKITVNRDPEIPFLFRKCARIFNSNHRHRTKLLELTAAEIWLRLRELWEHGANGTPSERSMAMRQFLEQNWNRQVGRLELAAAFRLTPEHVNSVFRRENGMTPGQYLTGLRVHQACRMLMEEHMTVKETAAACGFEDEFYFSRVFKKYTGRAPSAIMGSTRKL